MGAEGIQSNGQDASADGKAHSAAQRAAIVTSAPTTPISPLVGRLSSAPTSASGPRFVAPAVEALAPLFPTLEVISLIGQGGMGAVYKARQRSLDRLVALKVLPRDAGVDVGFAERFGRESRALAKLAHGNIVGVYDSGEADGFFYFLMEFVDGPSLRKVMLAARPPASEAVRIVRECCDALAFAHERGIVHRDIKPDNILIDERGRIRVADFGLVKLLHLPVGAALTHVDAAMGTPHYMAPEQFERPREVDHRADIYSLGVVLYELLTGELPIGRFGPPSEMGAPANLDAAVMRALEKDPARRFQSAAEFGDALARAAAAPPVRPGDHRPKPGEQIAPAPQSRLMWLGVGAALLAAAVAISMAINNVSRPPPEPPAFPNAGRPPARAPAPGADLPRRDRPGNVAGNGPDDRGPGIEPPIDPSTFAPSDLIEVRQGGFFLSERAAEALHLGVQRKQAMERLFRETMRDYALLERRHIAVEASEPGKVVLAREAFEPDAAAIAAKLETGYFELIDEPDRRNAEALWPAFKSAAGMSGAAAQITLSFDGAAYSFGNSAEMRDMSWGPTTEAFPIRYRAFWALYGGKNRALAESLAELADSGAGKRRPGQRVRLGERLTDPAFKSDAIALLDELGIPVARDAEPLVLTTKLEQAAMMMRGLADDRKPDEKKPEEKK